MKSSYRDLRGLRRGRSSAVRRGGAARLRRDRSSRPASSCCARRRAAGTAATAQRGANGASGRTRPSTGSGQRGSCSSAPSKAPIARAIVGNTGAIRSRDHPQRVTGASRASRRARRSRRAWPAPMAGSSRCTGSRGRRTSRSPRARATAGTRCATPVVRPRSRHRPPSRRANDRAPAAPGPRTS